MKAFSRFVLKHGLLFDNSANQYPTKLHGFCKDYLHMDKSDSTYYGFVHEGHATLYIGEQGYILRPGMYFCVPGTVGAYIVNGSGIVVERIGYNGVFSLGGPIEPKGRLKYIDGCTDSLLVPPVKLGDPCLNALYFPTGIDQTQHTHPTMRVGLIHQGAGICKTPEENVDLVPGLPFIIHEDGLHSFQTHDNEMVVIAYHPDSDFGPQDENHPMVNRTIVEGISAKDIEEIRTK